MSNTVVKSGAWYYDAGYCRSAYRDDRHPSNRFGNPSFRLALDTVQPNRTIRCSCWNDESVYCRSAFRRYWHPADHYYNISFRLALDTGPVQPRRLTTIAGGAWNNDAFYRFYRRSAYRPYYWNLSHRYHNIGLRLALTADSVQPRRTTKGGSWFSLVGCKIRSARRNHDKPDFRSRLVSLRLALTTGPAQLKRTMRGGGWNDGSVYCRSAYRNNWNPTNRDYNLSLRLALTASIEP